MQWTLHPSRPVPIPQPVDHELKSKRSPKGSHLRTGTMSRSPSRSTTLVIEGDAAGGDPYPQAAPP